MQQSMLTNPRPSNGINAVLGNIPASSAPSTGSFASMVPSVSNNVKEPMVNAVASYPVLVQPYMNGMERYLHPGDLIFAYVGNDNVSGGGTMRRGKPTMVANLPILNFILAGNISDTKYKDPGDWNFLGVMRNDMQLSEGDLGMNHRYKKYRRMINVDVRGATRCFNYWSTAEAGKRVGLVFMEIQVHDRVNRNINTDDGNLELQRDHDSNFNKFARVNALPNPDVCWQLVPAGLPKEASATSDRNKIMLYNGKHLVTNENARDIDVGFCFEHLGSAQVVNEGSAIIAACNYQEDRFKLPLIHMFIRT